MRIQNLTSDRPDRFLRQRELVPLDRLSDMQVTVIGVGAIGRQVALQLAAIGVPRLQLVDFDLVDATNITTQAYWASDIGQLKVAATAAAMTRIDPAVTVETIADRFRPRLKHGTAMFYCVDSIAARGAIWRSVHAGCRFWADGRMLGEVMLDIREKLFCLVLCMAFGEFFCLAKKLVHLFRSNAQIVFG